MHISFQQAENLSKKENSCVQIIHEDQHVAILPKHLGNFKKGVFETLKGDLNLYSDRLGGVPIALGVIKLLHQNAFTLEEQPYLHADVSVEFAVFKPKIGSVLTATVNKIGNDYLGCLILNQFNGSILKTCTGRRDWYGHHLKIGDEVLFTVKKIFTNHGVMSLHGNIDVGNQIKKSQPINRVFFLNNNEETTTTERKKKKKKSRRDEELNNTCIDDIVICGFLTPDNNNTSTSIDRKQKKKKAKQEQPGDQTDHLDDVVQYQEVENDSDQTLYCERKKKKKNKHQQDDCEVTAFKLKTPKRPLEGMEEKVNVKAEVEMSPKKKKKKHGIDNVPYNGEMPEPQFLIDNSEWLPSLSICESSPTRKKRKTNNGHVFETPGGSSDFTEVNCVVNNGVVVFDIRPIAE